MKPQETRYYMQAMERIEAEERLKLMDALQYPNMQKEDKKKKHRELYKKEYPDNFDKKRIMKTTDLELF